MAPSDKGRIRQGCLANGFHRPSICSWRLRTDILALSIRSTGYDCFHLEGIAVGLGRWLLLGDLGQQLDLTDQKNELDELRLQMRAKARSTDSVAEKLNELQRENEELRLYVAAMLRLLTAKGVASKDEIVAWVNTIDEGDGAKDGRYKGKIGLGE
jgi:hypothetical protein